MFNSKQLQTFKEQANAAFANEMQTMESRVKAWMSELKELVDKEVRGSLGKGEEGIKAMVQEIKEGTKKQEDERWDQNMRVMGKEIEDNLIAKILEKSAIYLSDF